ncbi:beta-carotene hydroxylase [Oxalobacteraceae bacterium GrIS 1.11]
MNTCRIAATLYPRPRPAIESGAVGALLTRRNAGLPGLASLGDDLLAVTVWQRCAGPLLPLATLAGFACAWACHVYLLLPLILVAHFIASVRFAHDVAHGAAGLNAKASHWVLFGMSLLLIESGHAFRHTHLHHHSHCLADDNFEGAPARAGLVAALLAGPVYLPRLWLAAFRASRSARERRWMSAELAAAIGLAGAALLLARWSAAPLAYYGLVWFGSWFYPLTTAYLPHYQAHPTPLGQARTLRGAIIPALLLNLSYHLEHHLYPQVPSVNLHKLAMRLDPHFAARGCHPPHVP